MSEASRSTDTNKVPVFGYNAGTLFASGAAIGLPIAVVAQQAQPRFDISFLDTYFVVVHVHLLWIAVLLHGVFAVVYFALPSLTQSSWKQTLGRLHFWLTAGATAIIVGTPFLVHRIVLHMGWGGVDDELLSSGLIFLLGGQVPFFLLFASDKVKRV